MTNDEEHIDEAKKLAEISDKLSILLTTELQEKFREDFRYSVLYRLFRIFTVSSIYHVARTNSDNPMEKLKEYVSALERYVEIIKLDMSSYERAYRQKGGKGIGNYH